MTTLEDAVRLLFGRMHPFVTVEMKGAFIEQLVWILDDNGTELDQIRKRWLSDPDGGLKDVALAQWRYQLAPSYDEASELLTPLLVSPKYRGRAEERLHECRERG